MKGTGSIRTGMRWPSCDGLRDEVLRAARTSWLRACFVEGGLFRARRRSLPMLGLAALALGGCVNAIVSGDFEPAYNVARLDADAARDHLSGALAPECRRLQQAGAVPTGEARVTVQVTPGGDVLRARLTQRTGDARIDELFGTTAARMKFEPNPSHPAAYTGRLRMGYSCSGDQAVGTIELF